MAVSAPAARATEMREKRGRHIVLLWGIGCGSLLPLTLPEGEEINKTHIIVPDNVSRFALPIKVLPYPFYACSFIYFLICLGVRSFH